MGEHEKQYTIDILQAMAERTIKRLWIIIIILITLLAATNGAWIWYESSFVDEVTETVETNTDGGGNAYGSIISGDNSEVHYGESQSNQNEDPNP